MKQGVDPYRILFPLGFLHAFVGASYWIVHALGLMPYPGTQHAHEMLTGFLLSYASGFLLTAVPKFTGSRSCSNSELGLGVLLSTATFFSHQAWLTLAVFLFLTTFFIRRLRTSSFRPPPHFVFLPVGLLMGIASTFTLTLIDLGRVDASLIPSARLLLYSGVMLAFLLGIGAKLISALLGWTAPPIHQIQTLGNFKPAPFADFKNKVTPYLQVILFISSFVVEIHGHSPVLGRSLRALCANWIALQNWHLHRQPYTAGKLPYWIWIASWLLILGLWAQVLFYDLNVHAAHLVYIVGYGLMTLLVSSRVVLAHGGFSLDCESKSRIYAVVSSLVTITGITRFTSIWTQGYTQHLGYAAASWIIGLLFWGAYFIPKIYRRNSEQA